MARTDRGEARSARPAKRTGAATATKPRSRSRTGAARSLAVPQPEPASVPQRRSSRAAPTKAEAGEREERRGTARARHAPRTAGMRQQTWPEGRKVATHVFQKESYVRLAPSRSSPAGFAPAKRRLPAHRRWRFPGCSPWKPAAAKWLLARSGAQRGARRFAAEMGKVSHSRVERNFPALREARGTQSSPAPPGQPRRPTPSPEHRPHGPNAAGPPEARGPPRPPDAASPHLTARSGPVPSRPAAPRRGALGAAGARCGHPRGPAHGRRRPSAGSAGARLQRPAGPEAASRRPRDSLRRAASPLAPAAPRANGVARPAPAATWRPHRPPPRAGPPGRDRARRVAAPTRPGAAAGSAEGRRGGSWGGRSPQPEGGGERHLPTASGRGRAGGEVGHGRGAAEPLDAGAASAPAAVGTAGLAAAGPGPRRFPVARC